MVTTANDYARPFGRSLKDFAIDGHTTPHKLHPAEELLLKGAWRGTGLNVGNKRPSSKKPEKIVRAEFIRFLALGGDPDWAVQESDLWIEGAWIEGSLNLRENMVSRSLHIQNCWIDGELNIRYARTRTINLAGSKVDSIKGDGVRIDGSLYLRNGFLSEGPVVLRGARIASEVWVQGGTFKNVEPEIAYESDKQLNTLRCKTALDLSRSEITTLWFGPSVSFDMPAIIEGCIDLRGTSVKLFMDGKNSWPPIFIEGPNGQRLLCHINHDNFSYLSIGGRSLGVEDRKQWLQRASIFRPQAYEQLVKFYRDTGNLQGARDIAIYKAMTQLRLPWRVSVINRELSWKANPVNWLKWLFVEKAVGYGYRAHRPIILSLVLLAFASWFFSEAGADGIIAPSNPVVYLNEELAQCVPNWTICDHPRMVDEHAPFNPTIYSLDLLLPIVSLGQETTWAPMAKAWKLSLPILGEMIVARWATLAVMWFLILYGWTVGIIMVAVVTGAVRNE